MLRVGLVFVWAALLAGCAAPDDAPQLPAFSDPSCATVARERSEDAVANGYKGAVLTRIARDAYAGCMTDKTHLRLPNG